MGVEVSEQGGLGAVVVDDLVEDVQGQVDGAGLGVGAPRLAQAGQTTH